MGGRAATNIPKIPPPTSNHRKSVIFMDHQKKEPPNSTVPKVRKPVGLFRSCTLCVQGSAQKFQKCGNNTCRCSDKGVALAGGGGG